MAKDPFEYDIVPRNNWELIWWAATDEIRTWRYVNSLHLSFWQERFLFLKVFFFYLAPLVVALSFLLWLWGIGVIAGLDLPGITPPSIWEAWFLEDWQLLQSFGHKFEYLFALGIDNYVVGLCISLVFGLVFGLVADLGLGLIAGLVLGLVAGLVLGLVAGLVLGLGVGLVLGLGVGLGVGLGGGLGSGLGVGLGVGLVFGLVFGLVAGLVFGLVGDLVGGLGFGLGFGLGGGLGFGLGGGLAWLFFCFKNLSFRLEKNAWLTFDNIDLSLLAEKKLILQSREDPALAAKFIDFLFQNRPKNHNLAALLSHVVHAKQWEAAALESDDKALIFPDFEISGFTVPDAWQKHLENLKKALIAAEQQTQISLKKEQFEAFVQDLEKMRGYVSVARRLTFWDRISATRRIDWHRYYREAVDEWLRIARQELQRIAGEAERTEPIAANIYKTGDSLTPLDERVFIDRQDLKNELSHVLYTTKGFSVLFLQGQRRVGKTSLVKFLPAILGKRFVVIYLDLQGNIISVPDFLRKLRKTFNEALDLKETEAWQAPEHWSAALQELLHYFAEHAHAENVRYILAIDEYEALHQHLAKDPEQGADFLGVFRYFSQHQTALSFMWIGSKFFSELKNPNWNEYFVNAIPITVGYLNREESLKLIAVAPLDYDAGVPEKIFELTQGHPALIQKICYGIVNIANSEGKRRIAQPDLDKALDKMIYITNNGVCDVFESQTCESDIDRDLVWSVIKKEPIPQEHRQRLRRLIEYGFILEKEGNYRLRVPIFETWWKKFA